ncbi:Bud-site selection protein [Trametes elegans]|nr:Bud-site selection protein [Trametes elegans]
MAPSHDTAVPQRGTKRKRGAPVNSKKAKARPPAPKRETPAELIPKKLHHGLNEVRKAAKKAAAFELRKLVKRLKAARAGKAAKGDDVPELEKQLEVLKHIDHEPFANTALKTKILKDRLLSENEDVQVVLAEKLSANLVQPQPAGSSAAKVHGRLLSSKTIAETVHAVVKSLKEIVDPSLAKANVRAQGDEGSEGEVEDEDEDVERRPSKGKKARVEASDESADEDEVEESDGEVAADDAGWESGTVDGKADGVGWESGTVDGGNLGVAASSDEEEDDSEAESGDEDEDEEDSDAPARNSVAKTPAKDPKGKAKAAGAESTFLPSLSVGFTRGDSSASDLSDADAEAAAADLPRKNRRGQRARRAIWEKKYGRNANHVKNQREVAGARDPRQRADRKGPADGKARRGQWEGGAKPQFERGGLHGQRGPVGAPPPPPVDSGWPRKQGGAGAGASAGAGAAGKKSEDKPLHPSWEAKRKLKEKLNPSIIPGQGKKIKFS